MGVLSILTWPPALFEGYIPKWANPDPTDRVTLAVAARSANEALRNAAYGDLYVLTRRRSSSYTAN